MSPSSDDACRHADDVGAYVLGALNSHERAEFDAHLADCFDCRCDVEAFQAVADSLPMAAPSQRPSPQLKRQIMSIVRSEAELLRAAGLEADRVAPPPPRWRPRLSISIRPRIAAAATGLAVVMGIGAIALTGGNDASRVRSVAAEVSLRSARAHLEIRSGSGRLVMTGIPRLPPGQVYEVWLQRPGEAAQPSGTFYDVADKGTTVEEVHGSLDGVRRVIVTAEPSPGSTQPTSHPIVIARLS